MTMFERYKGSARHRTKLLVRGVVGLVLCIPLAFMTLFLLLLELGNRTMDIMLEDE